ncbi:MAG: hypothetical protein ACE5ID_08295, partial [Acidobacteriota bacterium]
MRRAFRVETGLALLAGMIGGVAVSLLLGQDVNWDLQNYHLYTPYALLHGRHAAAEVPFRDARFALITLLVAC